MGGERAPGRGGAPRGGRHCPCDVRFGCRSHARTYPFQRALVLIFMTACLRPSGLYCRPPESDLEGVRRRPSSPCAVTPTLLGGGESVAPERCACEHRGRIRGRWPWAMLSCSFPRKDTLPPPWVLLWDLRG